MPAASTPKADLADEAVLAPVPPLAIGNLLVTSAVKSTPASFIVTAPAPETAKLSELKLAAPILEVVAISLLIVSSPFVAPVLEPVKPKPIPGPAVNVKAKAPDATLWSLVPSETATLVISPGLKSDNSCAKVL